MVYGRGLGEYSVCLNVWVGEFIRVVMTFVVENASLRFRGFLRCLSEVEMEISLFSDIGLESCYISVCYLWGLRVL